MMVYHGSAVEIPHPDTTHSKRFLDFGPGFYVTTFRKQAERWARRKCDRVRGPASPILNIYELDEDFTGFDILRFDGAEGKWLDFVCDCRDGKDAAAGYDAVIGRVADDDVFRTVQSWRQGDITRERALELLKFAGPNDQIALKTERIIACNLRFLQSLRIAPER